MNGDEQSMGTFGQKDLSERAKVIISTWACKKESKDKYHGQLNAWGFKQIAGKKFNPTSTTAPVTSDASIRIFLVLMLLANLMARIYDIKGAFLKEKFEDSEGIFMKVPQSMKEFDSTEAT